MSKPFTFYLLLFLWTTLTVQLYSILMCFVNCPGGEILILTIQIRCYRIVNLRKLGCWTDHLGISCPLPINAKKTAQLFANKAKLTSLRMNSQSSPKSSPTSLFQLQVPECRWDEVAQLLSNSHNYTQNLRLGHIDYKSSYPVYLIVPFM